MPGWEDCCWDCPKDGIIVFGLLDEVENQIKGKIQAKAPTLTDDAGIGGAAAPRCPSAGQCPGNGHSSPGGVLSLEFLVLSSRLRISPGGEARRSVALRQLKTQIRQLKTQN
jgi:hypothetical protein